MTHGETAPSGSDGSPRLVDNERARRYELLDGDQRVGFAAYRREPGRIVFTHTIVDPAHEGHGYGGMLARGAVADAVERGETIVPQCAFIRAWLRKHPDAASDIEWPDPS